MIRIGVDLGGTKIEACALDARGTLLARERIATERDGGYAHILDRIGALYRSTLRAIGAAADAPHSIGIGTPGSLSPRTGLLRNSNTACLNGQPLAHDLARALRHAVRLENDANCFALAEALHGAGRGFELVFGVILGTGCGGGIVHTGRLLRGRNAVAGEWGHTSIDPQGPHCYCGKRGCVETLVSGGGLEARYRESSGKSVPASVLFERAERGEPAASACIDAFYAALVRALANVVNTLDPDVIVLGGGVSNVAALPDRVRAGLAGAVFGETFTTAVSRHTLGDSAGVIGAELVGDS